MALTDEVQARLSTARLVQLTQSRGSTSSSVDTTRLGNACTDVAADFELFAGVEYDNSNPLHVSLCVRGVVLKLQEYKGTSEAVQKEYERWQKECERMRDRVGIPTTTSEVRTPEEDDSELSPRMDRGFWSDYTGTGL